LHEFYQRRRQSNGPLIEKGPKPVTNFLADRREVDAADLYAAFVQRMGHEGSNLRQSSGNPAISLAASGYKAGFQNFGAVHGRSQTCRFEVWPDLTAAVRGWHADLQAIALGEDRCFGSFDLGGECGQGDHGGSEQRQGREGEEGFEHLGAADWLVVAPPRSGAPYINSHRKR
jgi:hypothetical protein